MDGLFGCNTWKPVFLLLKVNEPFIFMPTNFRPLMYIIPIRY